MATASLSHRHGGNPRLVAAMAENPVSFSNKAATRGGAALSIGEFKLQSCSSMRIGIGVRSHSNCPHNVTFQEYYPDDSDSLKQVIDLAYRHVFGNFPPTDNERLASLEARLMNGDINVRGFVNGLAKSTFYKDLYFHSVSPQRGIELNFKHLLGRAPLNQNEIIAHISLLASEGYDALIDSITNSGEYAEVFGADIVPYLRAWDSPAGLYTSSFPAMADLEASYSSSDNALGRKSRTMTRLAKARSFARGAVQASYSPAAAYAKATSYSQTPSYAGAVGVRNSSPAKEEFRPWGVKSF